MQAAIALFLQYLPSLIQAAELIPDIGSYISRTIDHFKQSGEMTKEQEAALDAQIEGFKDKDWWQPE